MLWTTGKALVLACALHAQTATDPDNSKVDNDGNGLIEIWTLTDLNNMRYDLDGSHYDTDIGGNAGLDTGCPTTGGCTGYELMNDLDFRDADATGYQKKWVPLDNKTVASGSIVSDPADGKNAGWPPIGDNSTSGNNSRFTATFEGNGHVIRNLYINFSKSSGPIWVGLFGFAKVGTIQNVGLVGLYVKGTSTSSGSNDPARVGGLAGEADGTVQNCYAKGDVLAVGKKDAASAGVLLGGSTSVTIANCYTAGSAEARSTGTAASRAGGLVGFLGGSVTNCYTTAGATVSSSRAKAKKYAGGLAGRTEPGFFAGTVTNSYHSGTVTGATESGLGTKKTEAELKTPTALGGMGDTYAGWSRKNWVFGTSSQLPALRIYHAYSPRNQVHGKLIRGQHDVSVSLTADDMVLGLRAVMGDYLIAKDLSVDGENYLRVQRLLSELGKTADKLDKKALALKADVGASYTKAEADGKFALKTAMTTVQTDITALKSGKADTDGVYTKVKVDEKLALKADKTALALKADKTTLTALDTKFTSGSVGEKPADGTADTVWKELAAVKESVPTEENLLTRVKKADFDAKTKELDALKKEVAALKGGGGGGGGGNASALATTAWLEARVVVRPNPVRDRLVIESPVSVVATLSDSQGRRLSTYSLFRGEHVIDVSGLVAGSYFLVLQAEEGEIGTYKFLKHQ